MLVRRLPRVAFVVDQWGYGPVVMAIAIAEALEGLATRLFAGQGPMLDLARRACFETLVPADTMVEPFSQQLQDALTTCAVVVAVMNPVVARWAAARGIPCVYVDSLLWMWARPPSVPFGVRYFQEDWPGSAERLEEWRGHLPQSEIVGPLVSRPTRRRPDQPDVVLINFGGLSCTPIPHDTLLAYAQAMAECALFALDGWSGRVVLTVGRHISDQLDLDALRAIRSDVEIVDLSHDGFLAELRRSRLLISSAGTHAIFEACAWGVPTLYVPAQNLSQVLCLEALRREGVVSRPFDWGQLYGLTDLDPADEAAACGRIGEAILEFAKDKAAREAVTAHLRASMDDELLEDLTRRQARFFDSFGPAGAPRVAAHIMHLLRTSGSRPMS